MSDNRGSVFRSLKYFNARLFFAGLLFSNIGSWLQLTASSLLIYRLTGRAADLGYNVAFQFLPMLFFGTWCGALADRHNRRRIALISQACLAVQALLLGVLDLSGMINVPIVYALSLLLGIIGAFDNPRDAV